LSFIISLIIFIAPVVFIGPLPFGLQGSQSMLHC